jgi:ribosomal protein S18 acetylase RimI-like enzyme
MAMPNNKTLVIRTITPDDRDAIFDVYRQCEDFLALGPEPKASMGMVFKDIETCQREGGVFQGIFNTSGSMVGITSYVPAGFEGRPHVAFMALLMIAAPFRRQGLGTEVVHRIEGEIHHNPRITTILSAVQVNNPDAVRFWQKNGYHIVGGPEIRPDSTTIYHLRKDF